MLNLESIDRIYLEYGFKDIRKSIDRLVLEVQNVLKLDHFEKAMFLFCNRLQK